MPGTTAMAELLGEGLGPMDGCVVGVGEALGPIVTPGVGPTTPGALLAGVGLGVAGVGVGAAVGRAVGGGVGLAVGFGVGLAVGFGVARGVAVGLGVAVGFGVAGTTMVTVPDSIVWVNLSRLIPSKRTAWVPAGSFPAHEKVTPDFHDAGEVRDMAWAVPPTRTRT